MRFPIIFTVLVILLPTAIPMSLYNDLLPLYESSVEANDSAERVSLLLDDIRSLASFITKNVSQICPFSQPDYIKRIDKIVVNTLNEVYENEEALWSNLFYENIIPPVKASLEKCLESRRTRISMDDYSRREYPETLLHLDLKHRSDITKWQDFRPCIRTQIKSNFYPGTIPSAIDTLWQSFLLGYLGCNEFWGSIKEWHFLDVMQQVIFRPLFQRWSSKLPSKIAYTIESKNVSSTASTISSEIIKVLEYTENDGVTWMSLKSISSWLEKCNVILFLRHNVDPIPCFRDVIGSG